MMARDKIVIDVYTLMQLIDKPLLLHFSTYCANRVNALGCDDIDDMSVRMIAIIGQETKFDFLGIKR